MLTGWMHDIRLRIQAKTGFTSTFFIWSAIAAFALLVVFVFLCVTGYAWLSMQLVFGGLAMAGLFLLIALPFPSYRGTGLNNGPSSSAPPRLREQ
jgi:hypothetical protein